MRNASNSQEEDLPSSEMQVDEVIAREADQELLAILDLVQDLERQLDHSRQMIRALKEELAATRADLEKARALAAANGAEAARLEEELTGLQAKHEQLLVDFGVSEDARGEAVREIQLLRKEGQDFQQTIASLESQLATQTRNLGDATSAAQANESQLNSRIGELEGSLARTLTELGQRTSELEESLAANRGLQDDFTAQSKTLGEVTAAAQASQKQLSSRIADLDGNLSQTRSELGQRSSQLQEALAVNAELEKLRKALEAKIVALERSRAAMDKIHESLKTVRARALDNE